MQTIGSSNVMPTGQRSAAYGQVSRRTLWIIAGVAVAGLTVLALGANWIAFATLVPLLYVLPCAAMMVMCMKGMNHGQTGNRDAASPSPATVAPPPSSNAGS